MYKKKKHCPGGLKQLFVVLLLMLCGIFFMNSFCFASNNFDIDEQDLKSIYWYFSNTSKAVLPSGEAYHENKMKVWASGDLLIDSLSSSDWESASISLNAMMEQFWISSGEFYGSNSSFMNDRNLWVMLVPGSSVNQTTVEITYIFIPQITVEATFLESASYNGSNTSYSVSPSFYLRSGDGVGGYVVQTNTLAYNNSPAIYLTIKTNGQISVSIKNSTYSPKIGYVTQWYRQAEHFTYDTATHYMYDYGILTTYRNSYNGTLKGQGTFKLQTGGPYMSSYNGCRIDLGSSTIYDQNNEEPTPTTTPTPTPGVGGGGIIKEEVSESLSSFWGDKNSLSGESQISQISGEILSAIDDFSGDFASIGVVSVLQDFEQGFFDLLTHREGEDLDFRIFWPQISINALDHTFNIIPSGEVNFSELCRTNPTLSNLQSTIRVLFNFYFAINLVTYLYNLILSTLGIDNPFLYDKPETEYEYFDFYPDTGYEYNTTTLIDRKDHRSISVHTRKINKS